jgi:hypothetical protein
MFYIILPRFSPSALVCLLLVSNVEDILPLYTFTFFQLVKSHCFESELFVRVLVRPLSAPVPYKTKILPFQTFSHDTKQTQVGTHSAQNKTKRHKSDSQQERD